jgi:hypothetical protein
LLHADRLYKCSSIALLDKVTSDWGQNHILEWEPYLSYKGLSADCSQSELVNFVKNFGSPESICAMCPSKKDVDSHIPHSTNVILKSQWISLNEARPNTTISN